MTAANVRRRLSDEPGFTLTEMLVVLVILGVVLAALTGLFVSASRTSVDQAKRFRAQQEARLALDALRQQIHCARAVELTNPGSIEIALGSYCPTSGGTDTTVVWSTTGGPSRWSLVRAGVKKADYLTTGNVFTKPAAESGQKAKLSVQLPVDVDPSAVGGLYELQDDIVLRNSPRS